MVLNETELGHFLNNQLTVQADPLINVFCGRCSTTSYFYAY